MKYINVIVSIAAAMSSVVMVARDAAGSDVEPVMTFPAQGDALEELSRVKISLGRGFGPVGYDPSADGVKVYLEDEAGKRIMLVNAAPLVDEGWNLDEYAGASRSDVHTYKDKLYNDLFTRTHGWNGGDGVLTVGLPGGHVYWTFNDSFYGVVDSETRARGNCSFPRNTIMAQRADEDGYPVTTEDGLLWMAQFVQTTDPGKPGYYKALTHLDHPNAVNYNEDGIAQDWVYWSGDGVIDDGKLKMLWQGVNTGLGLLQVGTALVTYSLDGEPGDDGYLKIESVEHDFIPSNPYAYGSTLWEDEDGHIYLYSSAGNGQWLGNDPIVARTVTGDLGGEWEYYVAGSNGKFAWQRGYPTEEQVKRSGIAPGQGSLTLPWIFKKGNRYFMCAQTFPFGQEMVIMTADNPWGPFRDRKILIKFPNPLDELQHDPYGNRYRFLYMLNLHPALSRDGELVISTNTDPLDTSDGAGDAFWRNFNNPGSADWYRPFFYRVYGWENMFSGTMRGATDHIEFVPADGSVITAPGKYRLVCEPQVFGGEKFETSGFSGGRSNARIEVAFTIGDNASIDAVESDADSEAPVYYNMMGVRVLDPKPGSLYIERRGTAVRKVVL